ncbi:hypothetical protein FQN49_007055 [Arthroderma sp. PD_2]|nr:hypothetical protein FQN49_007055 [Arthroderma sp. PD_2]
MAAPQREDNFNPPTAPCATRPDMSRDPRRMHRIEPPPQNKLPAQDVQETVHILRQLTTEVSELTHITGARERVMKKRRAEEQALRKAKERGHAYPSLLQSLRSGKDDRDAELRRIQDRFQTHTENKEKLMLTLANVIHTPSSQGEPQQDQTADNAQMQIRKDEIRRMKELSESNFSTIFSRLNTAFQRLDKLTSSLDLTSKDIKRIDSEVGFTIKDIKRIDSEVGSSGSRQIPSQEIDTRIRKLTESIDALKDTIRDDSRDTAATFGSLDLRIKDITTSLATSKADQQNDSKWTKEQLHSMAKQTNEMVESKVAILEKTIDDLRKENIPSLDKNQLPSKAAEDATQAWHKAQNHMTSLSNEVAGLRQTVSLTNPRTLDQRFNEFHGQLMGNINALNGQITATHAAVLSLEDRYNQLTTEPIVRQMVLAMQEMYPHASKVQADMENLLRTIQEHLTQLTAHSAKITSLEEEQEREKKAGKSLIAYLRTEKDEITGKVKSAQSKTDELEESFLQSLAELGADLRGVMDELKDMKARIMAAEKAARPRPLIQDPSVMRSSSTASSKEKSKSPPSPSTPREPKHKKRKRDGETPRRAESNGS